MTEIDRVTQNLAVVENHFHSEALNEVEAALAMFTDDIVWEAPVPRYGSADEVAAMVAYLAGPEAAYVTGASLSIDGGFTA